MKCVSVKWSLNCSVYLLYKILCSSSCRVKCAYARFPFSKQSRHLRCDCHSRSQTYWSRNCTKEVCRMCKVSVLLKSSNCFLHLALLALFYLRQRSHLMPGNDARVRYSLGANVNTPYFQVPALKFGWWAPGPCVHTVFVSSWAVCRCFVLAAKLIFPSGVWQGEIR